MPEISRFYGIRIFMFPNYHPPAHFHVRYAGWEASIRVDTLEIDEGEMPNTAHRLVRRWALIHKIELLANWDLIQNHQPSIKIKPLV
ncbi:MAG: DUF4160 domain-containing protein [Calditrichaeota bacterium]|nr:DUF4160 domain-containing protein [Calditrichota bacterium]